MLAMKSKVGINTLKRYGGMALMVVGAILLLVCRLAGWQSNIELLIGLALMVLGFVLHVRQQKSGEKY
jgi:membrane-bound ClpP family serine protease